VVGFTTGSRGEVPGKKENLLQEMMMMMIMIIIIIIIIVHLFMCLTRAIKANYIQGQNNSTINILLNRKDIKIFSFGLFLTAEVFLNH
jgi:uncharacterized membrane protein YqjE